jgi:hypothetical protein
MPDHADSAIMQIARSKACGRSFQPWGQYMVLKNIDILGLLDTDPLAQIALLGLASVVVVTFGIFGFLLAQRSRKRKNELSSRS